MYILYKGPSQVDGREIVAIATGVDKGKKSKNAKTGAMVQVYIMLADEKPMEAIRNGTDYSICGNCVHRGSPDRPRTCYVLVHQGPTSIYRAYKKYEESLNHPVLDMQMVKLNGLGMDRDVRLGAYGDPAAVPLYIWHNLLKNSRSNTGYTHMWQACETGLREYVMASCDNVRDTIIARSAGWRTFRVAEDAEETLEREVICPATEESPSTTKLQCVDCTACNGLRNRRKSSIVVKAHGSARKVKAFRSIPIAVPTEMDYV